MLLDKEQKILYTDNETFILKELIGEGATAKVFKCYSNNICYAIKIFYSEKENVYLNEIQMLSQLRSNNIVNFVSYGKGRLENCFPLPPNACYIVFEYMENGDLFDYIEILKQGFPEEIAKNIFIQVLHAIQDCKRAGIVHNDIKTENILITNDFKVKLSDFGFAKQNIDNKLLFDWNGTDIYCSPEIRYYATKGYDGYKNDIFSLGVFLFILTVGSFPYSSSRFTDIHYKCLAKEDYSSFWKHFDDVNISPECKDLINSMMCFNPNKRISLENILEHKWLSNCINDCAFDDSLELYQKEFEYRKIIVDITKKSKTADE